MGNSSKSKNSSGDIIVQGSILAIAQIIVRLIGLFYRIPLQRIAGDVAMGYYGYAYDIYMLLLLVSSCLLYTSLSCCTMDDVLRIVDAGREYSGYYA